MTRFRHSHPKPHEIGGRNCVVASDAQQAIDRAIPEARNPKKMLAWRDVHIDGKRLGMTERPGELRTDVLRKIRLGDGRQLRGAELVVPNQPVGLVEPMFTPATILTMLKAVSLGSTMVVAVGR